MDLNLSLSSLSPGYTKVPFEDTFFSDDLDPEKISDVTAPIRPIGPIPGDAGADAQSPLVMRRRQTKNDKSLYNPVQLELLGTIPEPRPKSVWKKMVDDEGTWKREPVGKAGNC